MDKFYCVHAYLFELCIISCLCEQFVISAPSQCIKKSLRRSLNHWIPYTTNQTSLYEKRWKCPNWCLNQIYCMYWLLVIKLVTIREKYMYMYTLDVWSSVSFLFFTFPVIISFHCNWYISCIDTRISELVMYKLNLETLSYLVRTDVESWIMITHWSGTGPENDAGSNYVMLAVYPLNPLHLLDDQWRGFSGYVMISLWMNQRQTSEMMGNCWILLHWSNIDHSPVLFYVSFYLSFWIW